MIQRLSLSLLAVILAFNIYTIQAQTPTPSGKSKVFTGVKHHTFSPKSAAPDYDAYIYHLEAPTPGGATYRGFLREQRKKVAERFPQKPNENRRKTHHGDSTLNPFVEMGFMQSRVLTNGVILPITGGIPNDNTLAINNDGILLSAINSLVYAHDMNADTAIFPNFSISLGQIALPFGHHNYYDPKLLYDPDEDRFILTFLANNRPENSFLVFAFSSTSNPLDDWHVYQIPGNPLNNNRWTDFPCLAITKDEVIYTANFIIPDVSWQAGFDGSMIWQLDKHAAFRGDDSLPARLWHDVRHDGKFIRNLHPVNGATGITDEVILLSNRNFDIENDTFFVVKLHGAMNDPDAFLDIKAVRSNTPYGLAPNGRQVNTDPNDPTDGLDINDSRVLGAFIESGNIQFVGNTVNPQTGFAAIYHGFIRDAGTNPTITGHIIGHEVRDFGYPNIAWTGQQNNQPQSIIG
ncbi:MAG: hypothetical protein JJU02_02050, partial [Cryomorphaceae bacterium]|nr:hypothetical protein [Cryomorphaceae bacterium]